MKYILFTWECRIIWNNSYLTRDEKKISGIHLANFKIIRRNVFFFFLGKYLTQK